MSLGSVTAKDASLDACYGDNASSVWPSTVYLRLYNTNPTLGGTELSGGGYAAVAVTNNSDNWPDASAGQKMNGETFSFPTSTGAWSAAATYFWLTDSDFNLLDGGPLSVAVQVVDAGYLVEFPEGSVIITAG